MNKQKPTLINDVLFRKIALATALSSLTCLSTHVYAAIGTTGRPRGLVTLSMPCFFHARVTRINGIRYATASKPSKNRVSFKLLKTAL